MPSRISPWVAAALLPICAAAAQPAPPAPEAQRQLSNAAERVYDLAKPRILQIRTLLQAAGRQSTLGSGFLVSADGLAITNYHVVSQYALDPKTYRLEYLAPDGAKGTLQLLAFDVPHDLAVVKMEHTGLPFFEFDPRAIDNRLPKGERIYAMGNPLDL
ncbi:MAG TPA: serine protease, partial [Usitatibacter sp.]